MNAELLRQCGHAHALCAGSSYSVHFGLSESCSRSFLWFHRRPDQGVVSVTLHVGIVATPLIPRGNKPLDPWSPVPATLHCVRPRLGEDWVEYVSQLGYDPKLLEIYGQRVDALNVQISTDSALGRQYCVGHSYFTPAVELDATGLDTKQWWERVVDTDVRPLLEEYWFDRPDLADQACTKLLGA